MATVRRWGPEDAAGTVVLESGPDEQITPAPYGVVLYIGPTEKGVILADGKLNSCATPKETQKKLGSFVDYSFVPKVIDDYWAESRGAGEVHVIRLDDGTGQKASYVAYSRGNPRREILSVEAHTVGRHGGRELILGGEIDTVATDLADETLVVDVSAEPFLSQGMKVDQFRGGVVILDALPSKEYEIISNTASDDAVAPGQITVRSGLTMRSDYDATGSSDKGFVLKLAHNTRRLSVAFGNGSRDPVLGFSMRVWEHGKLVINEPDLSMNPESTEYVVPKINNLAGNLYVRVADLLDGGPITADNRPSTEAGEVESFTATTLTKKLFYVKVKPDTGSPDPSVICWNSSDLMQYRSLITLTVGGAGAVTATSREFGPVGSGTITNGAVAIHPTSPFLPTIVVRNGSTPLGEGDVIEVLWAPLRVNGFKGEQIVPDHDQAPTSQLRVLSNSHGVFTAQSGSFFAAGKAGPGTVTQSSAGTAAAGSVTFSVSAPSASDSVWIDDGKTEPLLIEFYTGTYSGSGVGISTAVASSISNAAAAVISAVNNRAGFRVVATAGSTGVVTLTNRDPGTHGNTTIVKVGTNIAVTSFTNGAAPSLTFSQDISARVFVGDHIIVGNQARRVLTVPTGLTATLSSAFTSATAATYRVLRSYLLESPAHLSGGHDGVAGLTDAHYLEALNPTTSPAKRLRGQNKGLVMVALPGKQSIAVQQAAQDFAEKMGGWGFTPEHPSTITTEDDFVEWLNNTLGRSDFTMPIFPQWWYCKDPITKQRKLQPVTGRVHGEESAKANAIGGYFEPAAGDDAILDGLLAPATENLTDLNLETLARGNVNAIRLMGDPDSAFKVVIWGNEVAFLDPRWRFKHKRKQMSHYINVLLEAFPWITFKINDPIGQKEVRSATKEFFRTEWRPKRAITGDSLETAVTIKIDADNNPESEGNAGRMHMEIKPRIANVTNQLVIDIGPQGISEREE